VKVFIISILVSAQAGKEFSLMTKLPARLMPALLRVDISLADTGAKKEKLLSKTLPPVGQFFHDLGHGGVFHFLHGKTMRLKRPVTSHMICQLVALLSCNIKTGIIKHIPGAYQMAP
jgi:hypothetical protein